MNKHFLAAAALLATVSAHGAVSLTSTAVPYTQNFDSLAAATGTNIGWVNDGTIAGWSLFDRNSAARVTYNANDGSSNAGSFYSFGTASNTDRALGGLGSAGTYFGSPAQNALAGYIALAVTNATGFELNSFTLSFDGEQWRNGGNTTAQTMVLEYGFGAAFTSVASWTAAGAGFNFTSPVTGATAAAVDGNVAGLLAGLGGTISTSWAVGDRLWVRWIEANDAGNDHGLAIDNLSLSVTAVPEPGTTGLLLAGLAAVGLLARRRA